MIEVKVKCIKCDKWIDGIGYPPPEFFVCQDCSAEPWWLMILCFILAVGPTIGYFAYKGLI